jgi:cytochrome d ubiquinol oxidase subunit II
LLVILLALIGRGVAFDYRGKVDSVRWRKNWDRLIMLGSWLPSFGVGLLLATTALGLPLNARGDRVGGAFAAVRWDTVLGGLAVAGFALAHGAVYLALKTDGEFRERARKLALRLIPVAVLPMLAFGIVVQARSGSAWTVVPLALAVVAGPVAWWRLWKGREGQAFAALGVLVAAAMVTVFGSLYPDVLPSTLDAVNSLTVDNASSSPYTLKVMSWVALFGAPVVLIYQSWTYWVFRKRIGTHHIPAVHAP